MKAFLLFVCLFLILGIASAEEDIVIQVIDGNTCVLENGNKIRYLGIDAPEKDDPFYREATQANNKLVDGKKIRFEFGKTKKGEYGRILAYVLVNSVFVNEQLLSQGYANDEYIVIENRSNGPMDFTGWTVSDEAHHRYLFPNFTLKPKTQVVLRSGFGKCNQNELFWGSRRTIWNNNGDTIFIKDANGYLVLNHIY